MIVHKTFDTDEHNSKITLAEENVSSYIQSVLQPKFSDRQVNSLLDSAPICIKILDLDFNLQYMSPAGIKSLNIDDITRFYNKPYPFRFYPQSFRDGMTKNLNKAVKTNKIVKQEASVVDLQDNELWFHSTIIPVENGNKQIESIMVISIESTACKNAEQLLSKNSKYQENMAVQFQIEHSNQSLTVNFMAKVKEVVLTNMSDSNFDVNVLAKHLFMSRSTLQRKLTKKTGVSAARFIRQMRLAKADEFIKYNVHETLAATAHAVGFNHPGYFSKLYKEYTNNIKVNDTLSFGMKDDVDA